MGDSVRGSFSNNVESYSQSTSTTPAAGSDIARTGSDSTTRVGSLVLSEPPSFNRQPETHSSLREPSTGSPSSNKAPVPSDARVGAFAVAGPNIPRQESERSIASSTTDSIDSDSEAMILADEYVISMDADSTDVISVSGMDSQVDFMGNIKLVTPPPKAVLITVAEPMEAEITYVGPTVVSDDDASISSDGSDINRQVELGLQFEQNFPDSIEESDSQSAMSVEDDVSSDHSMESQKAKAKEFNQNFPEIAADDLKQEGSTKSGDNKSGGVVKRSRIPAQASPKPELQAQAVKPDPASIREQKEAAKQFDANFPHINEDKK